MFSTLPSHTALVNMFISETNNINFNVPKLLRCQTPSCLMHTHLLSQSLAYPLCFWFYGWHARAFWFAAKQFVSHYLGWQAAIFGGPPVWPQKLWEKQVVILHPPVFPAAFLCTIAGSCSHDVPLVLFAFLSVKEGTFFMFVESKQIEVK